MRYRKLRIAWSVAWGVVAVLLIVFWVRSFWYIETLNLPSVFHRSVEFNHGGGTLIVSVYLSNQSWKYHSEPIFNNSNAWKIAPLQIIPLNGTTGLRVGSMLTLRYWMLFSLTLLPTSIPWFSHRFSLRTLLIATTLVAMLLGVIVYAVK
jgi:hypothetical protein